MGKCAPLIRAGSWFESTLSNQSRRPDGSRASRYERERRWFDSNRRGQISRPPDPRHCSSEGRMRVFDSLSRCHSCRSSSGSGARLWYGRWRGATPRTGTVACIQRSRAQVSGWAPIRPSSSGSGAPDSYPGGGLCNSDVGLHFPPVAHMGQEQPAFNRSVAGAQSARGTNHGERSSQGAARGC